MTTYSMTTYSIYTYTPYENETCALQDGTEQEAHEFLSQYSGYLDDLTIIYGSTVDVYAMFDELGILRFGGLAGAAARLAQKKAQERKANRT